MNNEFNFDKGDIVEIEAGDDVGKMCYVRRVHEPTLRLECMCTGQIYVANKTACRLIQKAILAEKTPWGDVEEVVEVASGIRWISASRHAGFKLDGEANRRLPAAVRIRGGWYEEDVEWSKVVIWHPELFNRTFCSTALDTFLSWFPDLVAAFGDERKSRLEAGPWGEWGGPGQMA